MEQGIKGAGDRGAEDNLFAADFDCVDDLDDPSNALAAVERQLLLVECPHPAKQCDLPGGGLHSQAAKAGDVATFEEVSYPLLKIAFEASLFSGNQSGDS